MAPGAPVAEVSFFLSFIYLLFSWTGWLSYWALPLTLGVLGPWKIRSLKQEEALEKVAFRHIPAWPIESEAASSFPLRPPPPSSAAPVYCWIPYDSLLSRGVPLLRAAS